MEEFLKIINSPTSVNVHMDYNVIIVFLDWEYKGSDYYHEFYVFNNKYEQIGHFPIKGTGVIKQLSEHDTTIFYYSVTLFDNGDKTKLKEDTHKIIRLTSKDTWEVITDIEDYEDGEEDGTFAFKKGGKWGFIDVHGNIIVEPKYLEYYAFENGLAEVKTETGWGIINKKGEYIQEPKYWSSGNKVDTLELRKLYKKDEQYRFIYEVWDIEGDKIIDTFKCHFFPTLLPNRVVFIPDDHKNYEVRYY